MIQGKEVYGANRDQEFQPLPSLTVSNQVGKAIGGMIKSKPKQFEVLWWTKTQTKGKWQLCGRIVVEVKREQPNECDIVTNGRNPNEIKTRVKVTKMCKET